MSAIEKLKLFLDQYKDRPDSDEIWGAVYRPLDTVTLGDLREILRRFDENWWNEWSNSLVQHIPEHFEDDIAQEAIIETWLGLLVEAAKEIIQVAKNEIWDTTSGRNTIDLLRWCIESDPDEALVERVWRLKSTKPKESNT